MNILAALLALAIYLIAARFAPSGSAAILTWALFAFASPLVVFSSQIYPEVPAALLSIAAVMSVDKYRSEARRAYLWLTGVIIAALPWLNIRYWFVVGAIVLVVLAGGSAPIRRRALNSIPLLLPLLLGTVAFMIIDFRLYGVALPNAGYILYTGGIPGRLRWSDPIVGFLGLFFDRARGLLSNSPVYFIVLAGLGLSLRLKRELGWLLLAPAVATVLAGSNYYWGAGWSPPSRFMLISVALTAPFAAPALLNRKVRVAALALGAWSFFVAGAYSAFPLMRYTLGDDRSGALGESLRAICGIDPTWIFPAMVRTRLTDFLLAGVWCLLAAGCALVLIFPRRVPPDVEKLEKLTHQQA
jgi:hypothetical protein